MLTRKQFELLKIIDRHLKQHGIAPSFDEMKEALGLKSKSGIHRLITALEERGFIRRLPHRARALEVLHMPELSEIKGRRRHQSLGIGAIIAPEFNTKGADSRSIGQTGEAVELPIYGRIAAGTPIEALQTNIGSIPVPASLLGHGEHYALEISGDSMIDAGIFDGDTVILQRTETAESGQIIVALIDNEEATLKRFRRKNNSIALDPANKAYETRIFGPDRVKVQGRLVALFRKF